MTFQQPESNLSKREIATDTSQANSKAIGMKFWDSLFWKNLGIKISNFFVEIRQSIENLSFSSIMYQCKCSLLFGVPIMVVCFGLFFGLYFLFSTARIPLDEFILDVESTSNLQSVRFKF